MLFVYVEGIARRNQYARPRKKPRPLAETISRTIMPSSLATRRLRYVRRRRKDVCSVTRNTSLLVDLYVCARERVALSHCSEWECLDISAYLGNMIFRIALSWRKNSLLTATFFAT